MHPVGVERSSVVGGGGMVVEGDGEVVCWGGVVEGMVEEKGAVVGRVVGPQFQSSQSIA